MHWPSSLGWSELVRSRPGEVFSAAGFVEIDLFLYMKIDILDEIEKRFVRYLDPDRRTEPRTPK